MAGHVHAHCMATHAQPAVVWNRSVGAARRHVAEYGTEAAATLADVAATCSVIFMCLPTSAVVAQVVAPLITSGVAAKVLVDCTSGDPLATQELARSAATKGHAFVDAPVSGGPAGAVAGKLAVLVGGADGDVARVSELLGCFAKKVEHLGPVGSGHAVKVFWNEPLVAR